MEIYKCNENKFIYHQVQADENINDIITLYNVTDSAVTRNDYKTDLYEGEVVKVLTDSKQLHIVKPMENLQIISQKYNISVNDLVKSNNLKSNRLFVGQTLIIK